MADTNIRHTKKGTHYKAPVLIAYRTMMRIGMGVILSMGIMFAGGYVLGFKQAENRVNQQIQSPELRHVESEQSLPISAPLPESANSDSGKMGPQTALLAESVETVDVGNLDERQVEPEVVNQDVEQRAADVATHVTARVAEKEFKLESESESAQNTEQISSSMIMTGAVGGPAESDPDQGAASQVAIYDNADAETARYSIQVGMYELRENAERKVEELMAVDLSAYLAEYTNKLNKLRYKVFFGYFADRKSAMSALVKYEKELAGSGYVIPLPQSENSISKNPV